MKTKKGPPLAQREVEREALKLFRRMYQKGNYLAPLQSSFRNNIYGLFSTRNGGERPIVKVNEKYINAFIRQEWLEKTENLWRLSENGVCWLRRKQARDQPYLEQHQLREPVTGAFGATLDHPVILNRGENPLGWLRRRKGQNGGPLITDAQFEAGERLRADFEKAQLSPNITANWSISASSKRSRRRAPNEYIGLNDQALAAKQRFLKALDIVGPELSGILINICCHLQGLEAAEKDHGWPQRSGKIVLQLALTCLARHYGLFDDRQDLSRHKGKITHWGKEDYRPRL